jgi:hypothetical protein
LDRDKNRRNLGNPVPLDFSQRRPFFLVGSR